MESPGRRQRRSPRRRRSKERPKNSLKSALKKDDQEGDRGPPKRVVLHMKTEMTEEKLGKVLKQDSVVMRPKVIRRLPPSAKPPRPERKGRGVPDVQEQAMDITTTTTDATIPIQANEMEIEQRTLMKPIKSDEDEEELATLDTSAGYEGSVALLEETIRKGASQHEDEVSVLQDLLKSRETFHVHETTKFKNEIKSLEAEIQRLKTRLEEAEDKIDDLQAAEGRVDVFKEQIDEHQKYIDDTEKIHKMEVRKYKEENQYYDRSIKEIKTNFGEYTHLSAENRMEHKNHVDVSQQKEDCLMRRLNQVRRESRIIVEASNQEASMLKQQISSMGRSLSRTSLTFGDSHPSLRRRSSTGTFPQPSQSPWPVNSNASVAPPTSNTYFLNPPSRTPSMTPTCFNEVSLM